MTHLDGIRIRPMTATDVPRLADMDSNFESPIYLDVVKEVNGLTATWELIERPFETPFVCTDFDFNDEELRAIGQRLASGEGLWLVVETVGTQPGAAPAPAQPSSEPAGRLVGMVDVNRQDWRKAGFVWNIAVDRPYRGRGLGQVLMQRVFEWGRHKGLRAIILETQTNNWYACRFYQRLGFQLSGIDDHYYTNQDVANKEVALFWTYEL
jgi:ribosomal protein S18 acetylase RimI-like enzyme